MARITLWNLGSVIPLSISSRFSSVQIQKGNDSHIAAKNIEDLDSRKTLLHKQRMSCGIPNLSVSYPTPFCEQKIFDQTKRFVALSKTIVLKPKCVPQNGNWLPQTKIWRAKREISLKGALSVPKFIQEVPDGNLPYFRLSLGHPYWGRFIFCNFKMDFDFLSGSKFIFQTKSTFCGASASFRTVWILWNTPSTATLLHVTARNCAWEIHCKPGIGNPRPPVA